MGCSTLAAPGHARPASSFRGATTPAAISMGEQAWEKGKVGLTCRPRRGEGEIVVQIQNLKTKSSQASKTT